MFGPVIFQFFLRIIKKIKNLIPTSKFKFSFKDFSSHMWPIYVKTRGACRLVENVMCIFVEYALIDLIVYNPFKEN